MSDNLPLTNRWLIALSVILCLIIGGIFTSSSAVTSQADAISDAGAFVVVAGCRIGAAVVAAADQQACHHGDGANQSENLFHSDLSSKILINLL